VLAKPDFSRPFRIYVDASDVGVGAVLVQLLPNPLTGLEELAAVAYKSRRFSDRERRWVIGEREAYGCKYGLESFREYILQHPDVTLYCDHHNMLNMWSCSSAKIARWRLYMQQFEPFKIVHVEGRSNLFADSLSRLHLYNLMQPKVDNLSDEEARMAAEGEGGDDADLMNCTYGEMVNAVNAHHIHHASCNHTAFAAIYGAGCAPAFRHKCNLNRGEEEGAGDRDGTKSVPVALAPRDPDEKMLEEFLQDSELLGEVIGKEHLEGQLKGNVLLADLRECDAAAPVAYPSIAADAATPKKRAVDSQTCDADLRDSRKRAAGVFPNRRLIEAAHNGTHPGVATTWARVQRACGIAPGERGAVSRDEVRRFVEACPICQKLKPARARLERAAGTIRQRPFTQYALDAIVLPEADVHGHRYILTVVDSFSGACELFPLKHSSADEVVQHLVDVMSRWTRPHSVRCDNVRLTGWSTRARLDLLFVLVIIDRNKL
jgi:hypothetical protein